MNRPVVLCLLFMFAGLILFTFFGNVSKTHKRRMLQNFVYRGYQALKWFWAVWRAVDRAVLTYYEEMDTVQIEPLNEEKYKPVLIETPEPEPPPVLNLEIPGFSVADMSEGLRRFREAGVKLR